MFQRALSRSRVQISSVIGLPPSTIFIGRPRGVVYWVARSMPIALVIVAIDVHDADRPIDDVDAVLVGRADGLAALEAAAAHDDRPALAASGRGRRSD